MLKRFRWNRVRPLDVGLIKLLGVSRSPTYGLSRSEKLGVSREVSCQIDLDFTCKPYGSGGSVVKKFVLDVINVIKLHVPGSNRVTISAQMKKRTHILASNPVTNPYSSPVGLHQC